MVKKSRKIESDISGSHALARRSFLKLAGLAATASAITPDLRALQPGLPSLLTTSDTFQVRNLYLNQVGYLADEHKIATVILAKKPSPDPERSVPRRPTPTQSDLSWTFQVLSAETAKTVLSGPLSDPLFDPLAGDTVCFADLSALHAPGRYRLRALGHTGDDFTIGTNVYVEPLRLAMRAFYGQRCGCNVDLGGGYEHGKCHQDGVFGPSSGKTGKLANHGGWHDAGD